MSWISSSYGDGDVPCPRGWHASANISNDRLLYFGGCTVPSLYNRPKGVQPVSPRVNRGEEVDIFQIKHEEPAEEEMIYLDDLWLFDNTKPAEAKWKRIEGKGDKPSKRAQHTFLGIPNTHFCILFGGYDGAHYYNDVHVLDYLNMEWKRINVGGKDLPKARAGHAAAIVSGTLGATMLVFGGKNDKQYLNDLFILDFSKDLKTMKWILTSTSGDIPHPRAFCTMNNIDTKIFVFGGEFYDHRTKEWKAFNDITVIKTNHLKWVKPDLTKSPIIPYPRFSHTTTLCNNFLYVFGGASDNKNALCDPTVFIFDTQAEKWGSCVIKSAASGDEPPSRSLLSANLLFGSKIFFFGGIKTELIAGEEGYVMKNVFTNNMFIFYHLERIEQKKDAQKKTRIRKTFEFISGIGGWQTSDSEDQNNNNNTKIRSQSQHRNSMHASGPTPNTTASHREKRLSLRGFGRREKKEEAPETHIGVPYNVQRALHVDTQWVWSGKSPSEIFLLEDKLGQGSFGAVYKARERNTGFVMAIKEIEIKGERIDELKREIEILKKFNHSNVVKYFGTLVNSEKLWILMEYCALGSIRDLVETGNATLTEEEIQFVTYHTLMGMVVLHAKSIIHRDIKAANVLLTEEGHIKLADFGVSDTLGKASQSIGTPLWMAPEVIRKVEYDCKCDVWSLGITLIEMADGFPPHHKLPPLRAMMMVPLKPPPTVNEPDKWSLNFNEFIAACLVKDAKLRPASVDLLKHPFVQNVKGPQVLQERIKRCLDIRKSRSVQQSESEGTFNSDMSRGNSLSRSSLQVSTSTNPLTGGGSISDMDRAELNVVIKWKEESPPTSPAAPEVPNEKPDEKPQQAATQKPSLRNSDMYGTQVINEEADAEQQRKAEENARKIEEANKNKQEQDEESSSSSFYGTQIIHDDPPAPVRKSSDAQIKRTTKKAEPVVEDAFGTQIIHDDVEQPSQNSSNDAFSTQIIHDDPKPKLSPRRSRKNSKARLNRKPSTSNVVPKKPEEDAFGTQIIHDDPPATTTKTSAKKEEDIYGTQIIHDDEPPPKPAAVTRQRSESNFGGTTVFHDDDDKDGMGTTVISEAKTPAKGLAVKPKSSPVVNNARVTPSKAEALYEPQSHRRSSSIADYNTDNAEDFKSLKAQLKALEESQRQILKALSDTKSDIVHEIKSSNEIIITIENSGRALSERQKLLEMNEKMRDIIKELLPAADQETLIKVIALLKKRTKKR